MNAPMLIISQNAKLGRYIKGLWKWLFFVSSILADNFPDNLLLKPVPVFRRAAADRDSVWRESEFGAGRP